jgi:two-component system response regulator DevR
MAMYQHRTSLQSRLTVFLLDNHELSRLGLRTMVEGQPLMAVVGEAATITAAVEGVGRLHPTLVITAARLADGDALEACRRLTATVPAPRLAVLSSSPDEATLDEMSRAGASGCLSPRMRAADLCRELRAIAAGESRLGGRPLARRSHRLRGGGSVRGNPCTLTGQERRVLALVTDGRTNKEIASALSLSEKTVKNYLSNVFDKLQVSRRSQAAVLFVREQGRVPPAPAFGAGAVLRAS